METVKLVKCSVAGVTQYLAFQVVSGQCLGYPIMALDSKKKPADEPYFTVKEGTVVPTPDLHAARRSANGTKVKIKLAGTYPFCVRCKQLIASSRSVGCPNCGRPKTRTVYKRTGKRWIRNHQEAVAHWKRWHGKDKANADEE